MVEWLAPIALFWTMAALYLGGFPLTIEGGGALRQFAGVLGTFVLFLVVFFVMRLVLRNAMGTVPAIAFACLIATLTMPLLAKGAFRVLGVRITMAAGQH